MELHINFDGIIIKGALMTMHKPDAREHIIMTV